MASVAEDPSCRLKRAQNKKNIKPQSLNGTRSKRYKMLMFVVEIRGLGFRGLGV